MANLYFIFASFAVLLAVCLMIIYNQMQSNNAPLSGEGYSKAEWKNVSNLFGQMLKSGELKGGAFSVYYQGDLVVDTYGGYADEESLITWKKETLAPMFSSTKSIAAIVIAVLYERGILDYDQLVSYYWPEFAQNGKENITIKQLISHQAGIPFINESISVFYMLNNPDKLGEILAKQKPIWKPGESFGYHEITIGLYLDQIVRRVDDQHRSLAQYFHDVIALPFELDTCIGLPKEEYYKLAKMKLMSTLNYIFDIVNKRYYWKTFFLNDNVAYQTISNPKEYKQKELINNPTFANFWNPSTHGYTTATSAAKLFGILANGGSWVDDSILKEETIRMLSIPQIQGMDNMILTHQTYGLGTTLYKSPLGGYIFGSPGYGGQMIYADIKAKLGWAFLNTDNRIFSQGDDPRYKKLESVMYETLKKIERLEFIV